ncbi:MarR family winged helix-turn-helix transcriptional regulator [Roseisalinus antarcticus]|uniref:Multidrug resistance operon repressor n=1 Tax=Roseisalinus antarcticus TaxID=254357 RepID=A0A1Y5SGP8_9RHOB|nr:MarR family transcriptional regulator [Roseisalinus antarcticus]SLN37295.1 Multidrug resistance operon repressor [Roseisalinus antarcticus]
MEDTETAQLVDRLMRGIHAGMQARAGTVDTARIGPSGGMILLALADIEPAPVQEVVRRVARDKSQMTRAIKALAEKGLLTRSQCDNDARVCMLRLTDKGQDTVTHLRRTLTEVIDEILAPLDPGDRRQLHDLLSKALSRTPPPACT